MVNVDISTVLSAVTVLRQKADSPFSVEKRLRTLGVSKRQWNHYKATGKMKVRPLTKAKIELVARFHGGDASNLPTILKMLEAREGKQK
jgi:hypothetical protein